MNNDIVRNLIYAQISFFVGVAIATMMTTTGYTQNLGLSYFGVHFPTIIPFGLGVILCIGFMWRAAGMQEIKEYPFDNIQIMLRVMAALLLIVLLTPDTFGPIFYRVHVTIATTLFMLEMGIAFWFAFRWHSDALIWSLIGIQLVAGVVALLSQWHMVPYLSHSSLVFQLAFSIILVRSVMQRVAQTERIS